MDMNVKLMKDDKHSKPVDSSYYQAIVGSLIYAAIGTRPDISQAVGAVSRYCANPSEAHMTAAKRICRYLKGTIDTSLKYEKTDTNTVVAYSDSDWAGDHDDRRSTSGSVFIMAGGAISWNSQKQSTVALSTAEAEYIALSSAVQEALWIRRFLSDLSINVSNPMIIFEDNVGAIAMANNPVNHRRTKHIDIKYHFIREAVQAGHVELVYCSTKLMIADILTKPLARSRFEDLRHELGLVT
jgi:hypothetical protein